MKTGNRHTGSIRVLTAALGVPLASAAMGQAVLEEVVVTAQKREQSLQDVPISVSSVSGDALQAQNLVEMETLAVQLPNIHISESAIGDKLFIRGIGSGINAGFEQSVGTFIDGVYYGRSLQTRSQFLDIERVEVLRGPQSTFFGNNAIAGALNITTRQPTQEFSGYVNTFYETENEEHHLEGAVGGSITDTLAVRVAGLVSGLDGWVTNLNTGATEGDEDNQSLRASFAFTPNDSFDATLKLEQGAYDVKGRNIQVTNCPPRSGALGTCALATAPVLARFGGPFVTPLYPDYDDTFDKYTQYNGPVIPAFTTAVNMLGAGEAGRSVPPPPAGMSQADLGELDNSNATLTLNWQLPGHVLTSVSGFSSYEFDFRQSSDFMPVPLGSITQMEEFEQFSQELRLVSDTAGPVQYMAGLYYQNNELKVREAVDLYLPPPYFQPASTYFTDACRLPERANDPTCRLPATIGSAEAMHGQDEDSIAVFGALTWNLTDALSATLGGRYARVEKDLMRVQTVRDDAPGITVPCPPQAAALLGCIPGAPLLMTANNPPQGRAFGWGAGTLDIAREDTEFTPSLSLQWQFMDDVMLYGSYTEGFKAGGFDQRNLFLDPVGGQFDPENVDAWEAGMKSQLLDGAMQFNLAVFRSNYDDLQVSTFDGVVNFLVNNAASARSQGVEGDMRWLLGDNLVFGAALAFLDAKWRDYRDAQCRAMDAALAPIARCTINSSGLLVQDLSGQDLLMAPEWSGNVSAEHVLPLRGGLELQTQLLVYFQDDKFLAADNDPATLQESFTKVNLRVALVSDTGWEVALVGRNLSDELTSPHAEDLPLRSGNSFFRLTDRPRTLALQAQYRW